MDRWMREWQKAIAKKAEKEASQDDGEIRSKLVSHRDYKHVN